MSAFPVLHTGAVAQYPASRTLEYDTRVLVFLDGGEQRFRQAGPPGRRWAIRLELLNDEEMAAIEQFVVSCQGRYGSFAFTDPWDGTVHPDCSLEEDATALNYREFLRGAATLLVRENRV